MTIKTSLRAIALTTALSLTAAVAFARSADLVQPPRTELGTAKPVTAAQVRNAILAAGPHHGWTLVSETPGVMTLQAATRAHSVTVDVAYDAHGFQVKFKSSENMGQEGSGDKITIHPHVNKWLSDFNEDIAGAVSAVSMQTH